MPSRRSATGPSVRKLEGGAADTELATSACSGPPTSTPPVVATAPFRNRRRLKPFTMNLRIEPRRTLFAMYRGTRGRLVWGGTAATRLTSETGIQLDLDLFQNPL